MFQVRHTIISDDIATFKFSCDLARCKGGCCVVGEAGAPVTVSEIPVLNKAWSLLGHELRPRARQVVKAEGLIKNGYKRPEINCTDGAECVFVTYNEQNVALCGIQKAWMEGRFNWIKPLSCELFPVRVMEVADTHYLNLEYVPELCSAGCERGKAEGVYLADFLKDPLVRAYGSKWYADFLEACNEVRMRTGAAV
ncbi:DUF3109 family protein [Natronogracilivirga saccharolytica]|uniref:DUF3109 family protein n=1 Tax=Natronogracilivirga saccharolytica TaxID=2812953 RepID=A0A8J7RNV5_9BACT|nr:DUF3109 family protein [Natronogracilivirga saccharolytica]MBP3191114.1 DUF3109 family protein [Natronogracilivirga saccharolytica]